MHVLQKQKLSRHDIIILIQTKNLLFSVQIDANINIWVLYGALSRDTYTQSTYIPS